MSIQVDPDTFARVMALPDPLRADILEFIGSCEMEREELTRVIDRLMEGLNRPAPRTPALAH